MKKYGVSRCKHCGMLHGLELPVKTTVCRYCSKRYPINRSTFLISFDTHDDMRKYLYDHNHHKDMSNATSYKTEMENLVNEMRINVFKGSKTAKRPKLERSIVIWLRESPVSYEEMLTRIIMEGIEEDKFEKILLLLMENGVIFLGKDGLYRLV